MSEKTTSPPRRTGGHRARKQLREHVIADSTAVVQPGMTGGAYKPLSERQIERIYKTALDLLEVVGMGQIIPAFRDHGEAAGCRMDENGRLHIPSALIEDVIANVAAKEIVIYGFDSANDLDIQNRISA